MGIQNSLNSVITNAAGAALAAKKMKESKEAKKEGAKEDLDFSVAEYAQAKANTAEIGNQAEEAEKLVGEKQAAYDEAMAKRPGGKGNTKARIAEAQQQALDDLTAAQKAFDVLSKKDTAAKAMEARWKNRVLAAHNKLDRLGGR